MYTFADDTSGLAPWIRKEVELDVELDEGSEGVAVKRVQEWLNLHGFGVSIDAEFGPATKRGLTRFQAASGLQQSGRVDERTFAALVAPMREALKKRTVAGATLPEVVVEHASVHLDAHPREAGGQNRGPWVRLYMDGRDGASWAWCAGFVTFLLRQAAETLDRPMPIPGSVSCDSLAAQAKERDLFLAERDARRSGVAAGSVFLVRRTDTDWTHVGLVTSAEAATFDTIEGNTNNDGSHEGFEVCAQARGYKDKDFILLPA